jgi:hypothetical protein
MRAPIIFARTTGVRRRTTSACGRVNCKARSRDCFFDSFMVFGEVESKFNVVSISVGVVKCFWSVDFLGKISENLRSKN